MMYEGTLGLRKRSAGRYVQNPKSGVNRSLHRFQPCQVYLPPRTVRTGDELPRECSV